MTLPEHGDNDAADAVRLVVEILDNRADGDVDECHGNSDADLLYAIEEARPALARLQALLETRPTETQRDLRTAVGDGIGVKPLGHTPPPDDEPSGSGPFGF